MIFQKIKSKLKDFITSKKMNVFLLFFVLAFVILLLTKLSKEYTNTFIFSLHKINIPEDKVILLDSNQNLEITIKAFGFELLPYYLSKPTVNIDFTDYRKKTDSVYIWTKTKNFANLHAQFSDRVELVNIQPDSILFRFDSYQVKKVPIQVPTDFTFGVGYDFSNTIKLEPDSVKVIGPQEIVSKIKLLKTDSLIIKDIKTNILQTVNIQNPNPGIKLSHTKTTVSGVVEKHTEGTLSVPITIINKPENIHIKYFPKVVNVSYYTSLKNFNNIKKTDFIITCDYLNVKGNTSFLIPKIERKPELVKYAKINQKQIEFIITQ